MNVLRDRIARRAAALLAAGVEPDIPHAIKQAAFTLGFSRGAPIPTESEVRKHLQGMAQESLGDVGYREGVQGILALAAELMDLLERGFSGTTLLAGRGARGHFDGGAEIHIRLYARAELSEIAQLLVDVGCEEPSFETIETTHGRANRIRTSMDGVTIVVVRCLPEWWSDHEHDLVTARPTATRTLKALRHDDPSA
ncbi:MAG TPA: hypothetical protein DCR70_11330 [Phycisphaerales bacterium]|nr:hypothetical protein [Phycisphaerales bacterium]